MVACMVRESRRCCIECASLLLAGWPEWFPRFIRHTYYAFVLFDNYNRTVDFLKVPCAISRSVKGRNLCQRMFKMHSTTPFRLQICIGQLLPILHALLWGFCVNVWFGVGRTTALKHFSFRVFGGFLLRNPFVLWRQTSVKRASAADVKQMGAVLVVWRLTPTSYGYS
jgi:hypothetical protein